MSYHIRVYFTVCLNEGRKTNTYTEVELKSCKQHQTSLDRMEKHIHLGKYLL